MTNLSVLECNQVSRWYGDIVGVNDLTFEVRPGITGLLGPNGSGKTTLMRMTMGLLRPSNGRIRTLDEDPWNNPGLLGRIGYVPDGDAPWRDRTGREVAVLAGRLARLPEREASEAADRALAQVGLADVADRVVETYSRGMRQRLKMALALVHEPELFILDEPLLGTDPLTRRDLIQLIRGLAADGRSVLVSTHILPDMEALTNRILLLNRGRLMAHGDVTEIRDLLDKYPRTVRIATSDARRLGHALWEWPTVQSIQAEEGALLVRTQQPRVFYEELQSYLARADVPFTAISSPDDNLESIFRYLVG